jgi:lipid-A-disaccharide synthase
VVQWLDAPARRDALATRFMEIHHILRQDTASKATDAIAQLLAR